MRHLLIIVSMVVAAVAANASQAAEPLPPPSGTVVLVVTGKLERTNAPGEARFDKAMLDALGTASVTTHSTWWTGAKTAEGVPLKAVLDRVEAQGTQILASALNNYQAKIPLSDLRYNPVLATKLDGVTLNIRDRGPLWVIYPSDDHKELKTEAYDARGVWQLNRLHVE